MTTKQAQAYVDKLREKWRLKDWKITVEFNESLQRDNQEALVSWSVDYHTAHMSIRPDRSDKETRSNIRHEMLHLRLEGYKDVQARDPMFEFGLNVLSELLT